MPDESAPWEKLPSLFSYIQDLQAQGMSEPQVADHLREIDQYQLDLAVEEMKAQGLSDEDIGAFWEDVRAFGDTDELDMIDADDPHYVPDGPSDG